MVSLAAFVLILFFPEQIVSLFMADGEEAATTMAVGALRLFALTYITRWFSFATQSYMMAIEKPMEASMISVSTALIFPVILVAALWPLGLTGIWLNFAATAVLAAVLSLIIILKRKKELFAPDES